VGTEAVKAAELRSIIDALLLGEPDSARARRAPVPGA
jgi:hypothetical protein